MHNLGFQIPILKLQTKTQSMLLMSILIASTLSPILLTTMTNNTLIWSGDETLLLTFIPVIQLDTTELSPYNMTEATFKQSEGDVLVYPSNITHGYDSNPSDQRITFTANIVPTW